MKINVSVIIPVYNASLFIQRAVESALIQEEVNEVIIIDDGSVDNSYSICKELEKKYPIVKVFSHSKGENKGPAATRNLGILKASNKWIQFLDADDVLFESKISKQVLLADDSSPLIIGNYLSQLENGKFTKIKAIKDPWLGIIMSRLGITSSNLWNKDFIIKAGMFDEKLKNSSDEYDLLFRILKLNENIQYDDSFSSKVFWTFESISRSNNKAELIVMNWVSLRIKIKEYLVSEGKFTIFRNYHFTGKIGYLKKRYPHLVKEKINPILFLMYQISFNVKKVLNNSI